MLAAKDLVFQVEAVRLLDHVSLMAHTGELIGLIGPNGAGKTTLLRTISGLARQQSGTVALNGSDLSALSTGEIARKLAIVHQAIPTTYSFTAMEVVLMGRYPRMGRFEVEGAHDRSAAYEAMALTETAGFSERSMATLSGGERQRVMIARALAQEPALLLLDEPTSNLDILHQMKTLELVRELTGSGMAAVAAIHDLQLAARYCHRLVLLHRGRTLAEGSPADVLTEKNIAEAFGVRAIVHTDTATGSIALSLIGPA